MVVNTGRATAGICSGHSIAKVIALNVRDDNRFRALFVHPTFTDPIAKPPAETPAVQSADNGHASPRGVDLADTNIVQLSGDRKKRLHHVIRPKNVVWLFPEDAWGERACTVRELQVPLIDEDTPPIAVKQQCFSPEQADAIQRNVNC